MELSSDPLLLGPPSSLSSSSFSSSSSPSSSSSSSPSSLLSSSSSSSLLSSSLSFPTIKKRLYVTKRDKREESISFDKITARIQKLCYNLNPEVVDEALIAQKVSAGIYPGVKTSQLDELAAEIAVHHSTIHPDYGVLAARIIASNLHKETDKNFPKLVSRLRAHVDKKSGKVAPMIDEKVHDFIQAHAETIGSAIVYARDYNFDYFGLKTLERSHLFKIDGKTAERPQHMYMRIACGIHAGDLEAALETYHYLSEGWFTHASPTMFNAGTPNPQLSSCFLLDIKGDSIEGIYDTLKDTALISKHAGGIGLAVSKIRASGSYIAGTHGTSNGLVPMLRVFNSTARYVDQGGGKRKGAFAVYLEPWHADIFKFLELRKNHGAEELRAKDLFLGLWVPDLFMERVRDDKSWSLFCPHSAEGLDEVWGKEFKQKYEEYERLEKATEVVRARDLWDAIIKSQQETGVPYMMYKDACNAKSNQNNLGTIKTSNLCTEIIEYTAPDEIAVCNLASISLPKFVNVTAKKFDFDKLYDVTRVIVRNLNKIININKYPVPEAKYSNLRNRPLGIGVQGLADAFLLLRLPFESEKAKVLNRDIFETIYFAALTESHELAKKEGHYATYEGSPMSKGLFQFDLWGYKPESKQNWNWDGLRKSILQDGVGIRNSLLVAPMPTATTSQILGNNECFEPYTSNLYVRRTLAGEFVCVSKHLLKDLTKLGLWNEKLKNKLIAHEGSVQDIPEIPEELRELYKTVYEMKNKTLVDMAADRAVFIDQSQSMNVWMAEPTKQKLTSLHFYTWKRGLKTGMYYLRSKAATEAIKFTVDAKLVEKEKNSIQETIATTTTSPPLEDSGQRIPSPSPLERRLSSTKQEEFGELVWSSESKDKDREKETPTTTTTTTTTMTMEDSEKEKEYLDSFPQGHDCCSG